MWSSVLTFNVLLVSFHVQNFVSGFQRISILSHVHGYSYKRINSDTGISAFKIGKNIEYNFFDDFLGVKNDRKDDVIKNVNNFFKLYNERDTEAILEMLDRDIVLDDYNFDYYPCSGFDQVERRLRLQLSVETPKICIDDVVVIRSPDNGFEVGIKVHMESDTSVDLKRGLFHLKFVENDSSLSRDRLKIGEITLVTESSNKAGENSLKILNIVSKILDMISSPTTGTMSNGKLELTTTTNKKELTPPEKYFEAWNGRDMTKALTYFTEDVTYDDTAFPKAFRGKLKLQEHLMKCSDCFPGSFRFKPDSIISNDRSNNILVQWHVENLQKQQPFTRGISFYKTTMDGKARRIQDGIDFVEPVFKGKRITLFLTSLKEKCNTEKSRLIPLSLWVLYMYIVFFSNGILPGANALQLEQRTWEEVLNLSLNFFLVAPTLNLPFSPTVHPMLEGVFNLLLSWAAMFGGFLSDDRRNKPNLIPMLPVVVGMQFLTSAFLLPYLVTRTNEDKTSYIPTIRKEDDVSNIVKIFESKTLGVALGSVGLFSILWALFGRYEDFGDFSTRWTSFIDLLSIDRVGSSFIVDLVLFGLFQGWLVDDDLLRRCELEQNTYIQSIRLVGKYIPFFGMAAYLTLRPDLSYVDEEQK